jgi:hypothetical protein
MDRTLAQRREGVGERERGCPTARDRPPVGMRPHAHRSRASQRLAAANSSASDRAIVASITAYSAESSAYAAHDTMSAA